MPLYVIREDTSKDTVLVVGRGAVAHTLWSAFHARNIRCVVLAADAELPPQSASPRTIILTPHGDLPTTRLALRALRMRHGRSVTIIVLVHPSDGARNAAFLPEADELMSIALNPSRVVDATGLGVQMHAMGSDASRLHQIWA